MKTPPPQRIADLAARVFPWALLVAALAVPLWAIWRLGPDAIPGIPRSDYEYYFYPQRVFLSRWLKQGVFPFWNPHLFCGYPVVECMQSALFYPLNSLMMMALPPAPGLLAFLSLHVVGGALLTWFAFAGALRLERTAALAGALTHVLGAVFASRFLAGHQITTCALAWMPLAVCALMRHLEEHARPAHDADADTDAARADAPSRRWLMLSVAATAMVFLSGAPQYMLYLVWMQAVVAVLAFGTPRAARLASCAVLWLLAGALAAPQIMPVAHYTPFAGRGAGTFDNRTGLSSQVSALLEFLFRYPMGDGMTRTHLNRRGVWDHAGYCGTAAVLLAAGAAAALRGMEPRRRTQCLQALGILALGAAHIVFGWLPGFEFFREPMRAMGFMIIAVAMLAALALTLLAEGGRAARPVWRGTAAAAAGLAATAAGLGAFALAAPARAAKWMTDLGEVSMGLHGSVLDLVREIGATPHVATLPFARTMGWCIVLAALTVALAAAARRHPRATVAAVAILMAADAGSANWRFFLSHLRTDESGWPAGTRPALERIVGPALAGQAMPARALMPPEMTNSALLVDGLWEPGGYDPLQPRMAGSRTPSGMTPEQVQDGSALRARRLALGVRWLVENTDPTLPEETRQPDRDHTVEDLLPGAGLASLVAGVAERADDTEFGPLGGAVDYVRTGDMPGNLVLKSPPGPDHHEVGHVRHVPTGSPNRMRFDTVADRHAVLVVRATWLPGWRTEYNGNPGGPAMRANGWMMALPVPAGRARVELVYRPPYLRLWLGVSLAAAVAVCVLAFPPRRRRKIPVANGADDAPQSPPC